MPVETAPQTTAQERLYSVCDYYDAESLLTGGERKVLGRLREFLDTQARPLLADYWERGEFPDQLTRPLIDLDLMEPAELTGVPGAGQTPARGIYQGFRIFELARTDASLATWYTAQAGLFRTAIRVGASAEQQAEWMPRVIDFSLKGVFSLTEPEDFVRGFLAERLGASELYLGHHFAFGRGKRGDIALLKRLGPECGFSASGIEEVIYEGEPISSTRIRNALERGEVANAAAMLGREYELDGIVSKGERVGHKIGYPTINLAPESDFHPGDGVYVTRIEIRSLGRRYEGVTNIGRRPTLYETTRATIETFVFDFSANVYGERVRLFFVERLREDRKFPSVEALSEQIGRDIEAAKAWFARKPPAS